MQNTVGMIAINNEETSITVNAKMYGFNSVHGINTTHGDMMEKIADHTEVLETNGRNYVVKHARRMKKFLKKRDIELNTIQDVMYDGKIVHTYQQNMFNEFILSWIAAEVVLGNIKHITLVVNPDDLKFGGALADELAKHAA
jgi:hypothetical protein